MKGDARFDLLSYLPGDEYQTKILPYQNELLPFVNRMQELVEQKNPVAHHQVFKDYTTYCRWPIRQMEYSFFIRHLPADVNGFAIDAGSGVTPFPYLLAQKGWHTVSTDIAADEMELLSAYGKEAYGSIATHLVDDLRAMNFSNHHFSLVTCVSVLEHLLHVDVPLALSELVRITKPGGRIIITTDVYPVDHPHIPPDHGAFTAKKIELIFWSLAKACGMKKPFSALVKHVSQLKMRHLEKFWTDHWQPGFWEGNNRGYCAIGMVFDLPAQEKACATLALALKKLTKHKLLATQTG